MDTRKKIGQLSFLLIPIFCVSCGGSNGPSLGKKLHTAHEQKQLSMNSTPEENYIHSGDFTYIHPDVIEPRIESEAQQLQMQLTTDKSTAVWPGGVIPYKADPSLPRELLNHMAAEYARAGIKIVPHTIEKNYVDLKVTSCIRDENQKCAPGIYGFASGGIGFKPTQEKHTIEIKKSFVDNFHEAKKQSGQTINESTIETNPDFRRLAYLLNHEMGHAVGCRHEHAHPDAIQHINPANDKCIENGGGSACEWKAVKGEPGYYRHTYFEGTFRGPNGYFYEPDRLAQTGFDKDSTMLYCFDFKDKPPQRKSLSDKLLSLRDKIFNLEKPKLCPIGTAPYKLSAKDVEGLRKIYDAEIRKRPADSTTCHREGLDLCLANAGGRACYSDWHCPLPDEKNSLVLPSNCSLNPPEASTDSEKNKDYFDVYSVQGEASCGSVWGNFKPAVAYRKFTLRGWEPINLTIRPLSGNIHPCTRKVQKRFVFKVEYTHYSWEIEPYLVYCQRERVANRYTINVAYCHQQKVDYGKYLDTKNCPVSEPSIKAP